jgi:hypothetical protein
MPLRDAVLPEIVPLIVVPLGHVTDTLQPVCETVQEGSWQLPESAHVPL